MNAQIGLILVILLVAAFFSPIHFLNRKARRYADEDLKRIDLNEWRKQLRWNAYSKFVGRELLAFIGLSLFVKSLNYVGDKPLDALQIFILLLAISLSVFGFWRFRHDKQIASDME